MSVYRVDSVTPTVLPDDHPVHREPPRPEHLRPADYAERFDATTVFYDGFERDGDVVLVGPPMLNIEVETPAATSYLQIEQRACRLSVPSAVLSQAHAEGVPLQSAGKDGLVEFAGRKVLMTKSKDNELSWISDWVSFHAAVHGTDAVLFYDNASTTYSSQDVLKVIAGVPGIEVAVVVEWPFKFGPRGGAGWFLPWDSDFSQYGILEHARQKYLHKAAGVINADIDELVLSPIPMYDVLQRFPAVKYRGLWMSTAVAADPPSDSIFDRHPYLDPTDFMCHYKWSVVPAAIPDEGYLQVHDIQGVNAVEVQGASYRHYYAVNTNWKFQRTAPVAAPDEVFRDPVIRAALDQARSRRLT